LTERVIWHDNFIPNKEVAAFFSAANLVVQPYKNATQSGVTQLAYHFNVPMVVTNVGALPEMVIDNKGGYVVEPNPKDIAEAIEAFFENEKEEEFRDFVKEEKKRFSWGNMVKAIDVLIN
jgi:glycosyltransferase involved in cell wall biosynthesis